MKKSALRVSLVLPFVIAMVFVQGGGTAHAAGPCSVPGTHATLQAALNDVSCSLINVGPGTFGGNFTINRDNVEVVGAGAGSTILQGTCVSATTGGTGIAILNNRSNVTIRQLTLTKYQYGLTTGNIGNTVSNITIEDVNASSNCVHGLWFQAGNTTNVVLNRVNASSNGIGAGGRGFWMINGVKNGISVTDGTFSNNGLVGIDVSDGNVTGLTVTGNTVSGNGDSGIGFIGAMGPSANLVANNTVADNGRFGIEVKMPGGTGLASGPGSVVVRDNIVSRSVAAADARDYAGIAVIKRLSGIPATDALLPAGYPSGAYISGNTVSNFVRKASGSTGDGFGIVVEGTNHVVTKNIVSGNNVGIQIQAGNPSINGQSTPYFDRGNAPTASALINRNSITGNTDLALRNVGAPATDATCNWFGSASGPALGSVSGAFTTSPYLTTSNLNGFCGVDSTPPTVTATPDAGPNGNGWNNTDVVVSYTCTDNESGVDLSNLGTDLGNDTLTASGTATGTCYDVAGNSASAPYTAQIDKAKPVITGSAAPLANGFGWNNGPVAVSFACADEVGGSGIDGNTVTGATLSGEAAAQFVTNGGACSDKAGNAADAATYGPVNIDLTKPVFGSCPVAGPFALAPGSVTVGPISVTDALSSVDAGSSTLSGSVDTSTTGAKSVTFTAYDQAGNMQTTACTYVVSGNATKLDVLSQLNATLLASTNKHDSTKLKEASKALNESLDPALWMPDGNHLTAKGEKVFQKEKEAVQKLTELIKDKNSDIPDATLQGWIDALVAVDRSLAATAIDDAVTGGAGASKQVADANREMQKGDDAGKDPDSIEHYKNAWKKAMEAQKKL